MKVACVLLTHLRAKVEVRRHPHLEDSPVVIVDRDPSTARPLVVDRFPAASGVAVGMTLEQAMSRHANAIVLDADEPYYQQVFGQVLGSLQGVSDRVEGAELGIAYVRIDGLEGLFHGEAGVVSTLLNAVPAYLNPRVGVADAKFPAFVAARTCRPLGAFRVPDHVGTFLAPHSIDLLPISAGVKTGMHRFGLHTMEAVASMSGHVLTDQFGSEGGRAWALCNGIDDSPVVPMPFDESVVEHISLPFHSSSIEVLFVAVDSLLQRAYARPELRRRYAGTAVLRCTASGWQPWEKVVGFREPVGAWDRASSVIRYRVESDPPEIPVDDVTLTLSGFTGEAGTQDESSEGRPLRIDRHRRLVEVERRLRERMNGQPCVAQGGGGRTLASGARNAGRAGAHRPIRQGRHQAPVFTQARGGAGRDRARAGVRAHGQEMGAGDPNIGQVDVRPVVAPKTRKPHLLPDRPGRRQADHPVPRPHQRPLV